MQGAINMFKKKIEEVNAISTWQTSSVQVTTEGSRAAHKTTISKSRMVFSWSRMKSSPQNTAQHSNESKITLDPHLLCASNYSNCK